MLSAGVWGLFRVWGWHKWGAGLGLELRSGPSCSPLLTLWNLGLLRQRLSGSVKPGAVWVCAVPWHWEWAGTPWAPISWSHPGGVQGRCNFFSSTSWPSVSCPAAGQMRPSSFKHPRLPEGPREQSFKKGKQTWTCHDLTPKFT